MSNINIRYKENIEGVFFSSYPKPEGYLQQVKEAIQDGLAIPRINESFDSFDELAFEIPELFNLIDNDTLDNLSNVKLSINRDEGLINGVLNLKEGEPITLNETINYANNSGTYQAFDGREIPEVSFIVNKSNNRRIITPFSTTMIISEVDEDGVVTEVSFADINIVLPDFKPEGGEDGVRTGVTFADINIVLPDFEPEGGEYYVQHDEILIKLNIIKDEESELPSYEVSEYEILNGGDGYEVETEIDVSIANGYSIIIVNTVLNNGEWLINEEELEEGFFYDFNMEFRDDDVTEQKLTFNGLFKRVGNRFVNESFRILGGVTAAADDAAAQGAADSVIIRPNSFLLENIILSNRMVAVLD
jgi:hypothetical protein